MIRFRPKSILLLSAGGALAALIAVAIAGRERILEEWYAHVIASGSEEEKLHAAEKLAKMGSGRAVVWLFEETQKELEAGKARAWERNRNSDGLSSLFGSPRQFLGKRGEHLLSVLVKTGQPALPTLIPWLARADGKDEAGSFIALIALAEMDPGLWLGPQPKTAAEARSIPPDERDWPEIRALRLLSEDPSRLAAVRKAAAETLPKLEALRSRQQPHGIMWSNPPSRS